MMSTDVSGRAFWIGTVAAVLLAVAVPLRADESGSSVWVPGFFGSLAAVPGAPGWSLATIYYHTDVDAGKSDSFPIGGRTSLGIDAKADLLFVAPTYTFETPVLGGQAATALAISYMHMKSEADATLTGPRGRTLEFNPSDSLTAVGDALSLNTLKWNDGTNNYLTYLGVAIPVGDYEEGRLANTSVNHWAIDGGAGYTYLDMKSRNEFSATLGFTYNFENDDTDYQNGVDAHLDVAASHFVTPQTHIGIVGYAFHQITDDDGDGARLGGFRSRVAGIGPQIGHFFAASDRKYYVNLKGYYEFDGHNRPEGWNAWLSLLIPLEAERKQ